MRKIECIVVHHRGADMLSACLESVLSSEGVEVEATVVANGCEEDLPSWIESCDRVRVLRPKRELGFAEANNYAVDWLEKTGGPPGSYFFLNNDAVVDPRALEILSQLLFSSPEIGAVGPKILIWGASDHLNSLGLNVTVFAEAWDEGIGRRVAEVGEIPAEREVVALTGAAVMVRASAFRDAGGWSRIYRYYMEDIDLCIRLRARGWKVINTAGAVAYHAISATSDSTIDMKRFYSWRNQFIVMLVHWPLRLLATVAPRLAMVQLGIFVRRLRARAYGDARLQASAWWGALLKVPTAMNERRKICGDASWTNHLLAAGTVPVIELPKVRDKPWHNGGRNLEGNQPRYGSDLAREGAE